MITRINGKWTVDGKKYRYMTRNDKQRLSNFMLFMKEAHSKINSKSHG